ncbi:hypothetical protein FB45DRAFT_363112 [Roridomyces roridus]|uniref:Uncharacterized protein n=1 Tax=Roridomyces roridus TaxID=1738132 RepID=A0AAD7C8Y2_9AGAR|nr:hypothetical protein FB45DRAFT_363112 [Roridomyces roridus]
MHLNHLDDALVYNPSRFSDFPDLEHSASFSASDAFSSASSAENAMPPNFHAVQSYSVDGIQVGYSVPSAHDVATDCGASEGAVPPDFSAVANEGRSLLAPSQDEVVAYLSEGAGQGCGVNGPEYFAAPSADDHGASGPCQKTPDDFTINDANQQAVEEMSSPFTLDMSGPLSHSSYLHVARAPQDSGLSHAAPHFTGYATRVAYPSGIAYPSGTDAVVSSGYLDNSPAEWFGIHDDFAVEPELSSGNGSTTPTEDRASEYYYSPQSNLPSVGSPTPDAFANAENVPPSAVFGQSTKDDYPLAAQTMYQQPVFFVSTPESFPHTVGHGASSTAQPEYFGAYLPSHDRYAYPLSAPVPDDATSSDGGEYYVPFSEQSGRKRKGKEVDREEMDLPVAKKPRQMMAMTTTSPADDYDSTAEGSSAPVNTQPEGSCSLAGTLTKAAALPHKKAAIRNAKAPTTCWWPGCRAPSISTDGNEVTRHLKAFHGMNHGDAFVCRWPVETGGGAEAECGQRFQGGARGIAKHLQSQLHLKVKFCCTNEGCEGKFARPEGVSKHLEISP